MRYALVDGQLSEAHESGQRGTCEMCGGEALARCGQINQPHWSHIKAECDTWSEPMTLWHRQWQDLFPAPWRERPIGQHRADISRPSDLFVVEVQHSSINAAAIHEREVHYGAMLWIFNACDLDKDGVQSWSKVATFADLHLGGPAHYRRFSWPYPRRSLAACLKRVLLDLGNELLVLENAAGGSASGHAWTTTREDLRDFLVDSDAVPDLDMLRTLGGHVPDHGFWDRPARRSAEPKGNINSAARDWLRREYPDRFPNEPSDEADA